MDYNGFRFGIESAAITHIRTKQEKRGSRWISVSSASENVNCFFYQNFVQSIPFFRSRAQWGYTYYGYMPTCITTVSPHEPVRYMDTFIFEKRENK